MVREVDVLEGWVGFVCFHHFGGEQEEDPYTVVVS